MYICQYITGVLLKRLRPTYDRCFFCNWVRWLYFFLFLIFLAFSLCTNARLSFLGKKERTLVKEVWDIAVINSEGLGEFKLGEELVFNRVVNQESELSTIKLDPSYGAISIQLCFAEPLHQDDISTLRQYGASVSDVFQTESGEILPVVRLDFLDDQPVEIKIKAAVAPEPQCTHIDIGNRTITYEGHLPVSELNPVPGSHWMHWSLKAARPLVGDLSQEEKKTSEAPDYHQWKGIESGWQEEAKKNDQRENGQNEILAGGGQGGWGPDHKPGKPRPGAFPFMAQDGKTLQLEVMQQFLRSIWQDNNQGGYDQAAEFWRTGAAEVAQYEGVNIQPEQLSQLAWILTEEFFVTYMEGFEAYRQTPHPAPISNRSLPGVGFRFVNDQRGRRIAPYLVVPSLENPNARPVLIPVQLVIVDRESNRYRPVNWQLLRGLQGDGDVDYNRVPSLSVLERLDDRYELAWMSEEERRFAYRANFNAWREALSSDASTTFGYRAALNSYLLLLASIPHLADIRQQPEDEEISEDVFRDRLIQGLFQRQLNNDHSEVTLTPEGETYLRGLYGTLIRGEMEGGESLEAVLASFSNIRVVGNGETQEPMDAVDSHNQPVASSSTNAQGSSQSSPSSRTNDRSGLFQRERRGGAGGDDPAEPGLEEVESASLSDVLQNLELVGTLDTELLNAITRLAHQLQEYRDYLQTYVNQFNTIFAKCLDDKKLQAEELACDLGWLLQAHLDSLNLINKLLSEWGGEELDKEIILKLLVLQNPLSKQVSMNTIKALILFIGASNPLAFIDSSESDGSRENKELVSNNKAKIIGLIDYLYSRIKAIDELEVSPVLEGNEPLAANFLVKVEEVAKSFDALQVAPAGLEFQFNKKEVGFNVKSFAFVLDKIFLQIAGSPDHPASSVNMAVKKVRKRFFDESGSQRFVREKIEHIIYNQVFIYLLGHVDLEMLGEDESVYWNKLYGLVDSISKNIINFAKMVKSDMKFGGKINILRFERRLDDTFSRSYMEEGVAEVVRSIIVTSGIELLLMVRDEVQQFVGSDKMILGEESRAIDALVENFIWNASMGLNGGGLDLDYSSQDVSFLAQTLHVLDNGKKQYQARILALKNSEEYLRNVRFSKGEEVKEKFAKAYVEGIILQKNGNGRLGEVIFESVHSLESIMEKVFGSLSIDDFELFKHHMLLANGFSPKDIKDWHLSFVKGLLLQHEAEKSADNSQQEEGLDKILQRTLTSPSTVGGWALGAAKWLKKKKGAKPFYLMSHDNNRALSLESLAHINSKMWVGERWWFFTGNHIHDRHARHSKDGVLAEVVPFIDTALSDPTNLNSWYTALINSLLLTEHNIKNGMMDVSAHSELNQLLKHKVEYFKGLINSKPRVIEKGKFHLFDIITEAAGVIDSEFMHQLDQLREGLQSSHKRYHRQLVHLIEGKRDDESEVNSIPPFYMSRSFMTFAKYFSYGVLDNITKEEFRFLVTPDLNSINLLSQIVSFLQIKVSYNSKEQFLYEAIGLGQEVFDTISSYYVRLASEHYQQLGSLIGEKFYALSESSIELKSDIDRMIKQLKNHNLYSFQEELDKYWKEHKNSSRPDSVDAFHEQLVKDVNVVISLLMGRKMAIITHLSNSARKPSGHGSASVHTGEAFSSDTVVSHQPPADRDRERIQRLTSEDDVATSNDSLLGRSSGTAQQEEPVIQTQPKNPEVLLKELDGKIRAGELIKEYLELLKEYRELDSEIRATEGDKQALEGRLHRWVKKLEEKEGVISLLYFVSSFGALYYRTLGDGFANSHYSSGVPAPFGTKVIPKLDIAVDFWLLGVSLGSVISQFSQAAGWNVDISKKLALNKETLHFSFAISELPTVFKDQLIRLYLNNIDAEKPVVWEESKEKNPYSLCSNCQDSCMDFLSCLCCRRSPVADCCCNPAPESTCNNCVGVCSYLVRLVFVGNRIMIRDSVRGGFYELLLDADQKTRNRRASSLVRLLGENTPKSLNNCFGVSIPQQLLAYLIHLVDGHVALVEISDMALMREAQGGLECSEKAIEKLFDDIEMDQYDMDRLTDMFGRVLAGQLMPNQSVSDTVESEVRNSDGPLGVTPDSGQDNTESHLLSEVRVESDKEPSSRNPDLKQRLETPGYSKNQRTAKFLRVLASVLHGGATAVVCYDLYHFLYRPLTELGVLDALAEYFTGRDGESSSAQGSNQAADMTTAESSSLFPDTTIATEEPVCRSSVAEKMPGKGESKLECSIAHMAEYRKSYPWLRFLTVAGSKTGANIAWFIDSLAANLERGRLSYDPEMLGTLVAGILKNTILGPSERAAQTSPEITVNTMGDVVGQLDTYLKEAIESTVQRQSPKASLALVHAGRQMIMQALHESQGDPIKAHRLLEGWLTHIESKVGFEAMNAFANMRQQWAAQSLVDTTPKTGESFQEFKSRAMEEVSGDLPSLQGKRELAPELIASHEKFKRSAQKFLKSIDEGKPLLSAFAEFFHVLKESSQPMVNYFVESLIRPEEISQKVREEAEDRNTEEPAHSEGFWDEVVQEYKKNKEKLKLILNRDETMERAF